MLTLEKKKEQWRMTTAASMAIEALISRY